MQNSFFDCEKTVSFNSLDEDLKVNTCIIGGGLAGLMCAYELSRRGIKTCVLEKGKIGDGETARSSAFISYAHDLIYDRLIKKHGIKTAKSYLDMQKYGLNEIERIIDENSIDCDKTSHSLILFSQTPKYAKKLIYEYQAYLELGQRPQLIETDYLELSENISLNIFNALKIDNQLAINPLKFLLGLAKVLQKNGVRIFENTPAYTKPKDKVLSVKNHKITADRFVVATHFPYINFPGLYFLKMYQHRSHSIALKLDLANLDLYESCEENGFEYRTYKDKLIISGGNVRVGKYKHKSRYQMLESHAKSQFNKRKDDILAYFSAQDCMTPDLMPFCGRFGCLTDGLYVITGFNKWGFTNSAACAKIIADNVCNKQDKQNIFDPTRHAALKSPKYTVAHVGVIIGSFFDRLIKSDAKKFDRIIPNTGAVVKIKGKRVGVYKEENGKIHAIAAVCPHLGCSLKWNKDDLSWDCPCHGSRFDIDGNILNNPAIEKATTLNGIFKN